MRKPACGRLFLWSFWTSAGQFLIFFLWIIFDLKTKMHTPEWDWKGLDIFQMFLVSYLSPMPLNCCAKRPQYWDFGWSLQGCLRLFLHCQLTWFPGTQIICPYVLWVQHNMGRWNGLWIFFKLVCFFPKSDSFNDLVPKGKRETNSFSKGHITIKLVDFLGKEIKKGELWEEFFIYVLE